MRPRVSFVEPGGVSWGLAMATSCRRGRRDELETIMPTLSAVEEAACTCLSSSLLAIEGSDHSEKIGERIRVNLSSINDRSSKETLNDQQENLKQRQELEKLRTDNMILREANAHLKEELARCYALVSSFVGRISTSIVAPGLSSPLGSSIMGGEVQPIDSWLFKKLAREAMNELCQMVQTDEPLWVPSIDGKEVLSYEEYVQISPRRTRQKPHNMSEASRYRGIVMIPALDFVEILMDASRWADTFHLIVGRATTIEIVSNSVAGNRNGAIILMRAELQVLSPLVPVRAVDFLRYSEQRAERMWMVVDISIDNIRESPPVAGTHMSCRRLPSGCLVEDLQNGYSMVTWVEHAEYDDSVVDPLYQSLLSSGMGLGAQRWVANLRRHCECLVIRSPVQDRIGITAQGWRSVVKLAQRMVDSFCACVCVTSVHKWTPLSGGAENVRVITRQSVNGEPTGVILSAATSILLSNTHDIVFDFLCTEETRKYWDFLCRSAVVQEMSRIPKDQASGDVVSILSVSHTTGRINMILQETCTDTLGSIVVYAPVKIPDTVRNGGDSASVTLLPCGFAIDQHNEGSLLTIAIQLHADAPPITEQSVTVISNLILTAIRSIKESLLKFFG